MVKVTQTFLKCTAMYRFVNIILSISSEDLFGYISTTPM